MSGLTATTQSRTGPAQREINVSDKLQAGIRVWLSQIGQRGGRGGVGAAKRRTPEHYRAAGLASAARRAAKRKAVYLTQQGQAGGVGMGALYWLAVASVGAAMGITVLGATIGAALSAGLGWGF